MPEYVNISAPDKETVDDKCEEQYPEYEAFQIIGETIAATSGNPGFYKVAAFDTQDEYEEWITEQDWL